MHWPNFEFLDIKHNAWRKNKRTGKVELLYTLDNQHQQHGRRIFKNVVQEWPEDLPEGTNTAGSGKDQEWNPDEE